MATNQPRHDHDANEEPDEHDSKLERVIKKIVPPSHELTDDDLKDPGNMTPDVPPPTTAHNATQQDVSNLNSKEDMMATKEQCDQYAAELVDRFEDLTRWAMTNWPRDDFPLLKSDFDQSRREIGGILGAKLGDGDSGNGDGASRSGRSGGDDSPQYVDMNPMPWP